ncbi:hypothetical protein [Methanosarcina barkeri]|nr:hypothetical protein [Methanosarcina barkeri]
MEASSIHGTLRITGINKIIMSLKYKRMGPEFEYDEKEKFNRKK